ncbi:MAG: hypothetical protein IT243_01805 [Bacteroidia bacterium]|nr:hypothetical protein [Bacteroidia bacterium]
MKLILKTLLLLLSCVLAQAQCDFVLTQDKKECLVKPIDNACLVPYSFNCASITIIGEYKNMCNESIIMPEQVSYQIAEDFEIAIPLPMVLTPGEKFVFYFIINYDSLNNKWVPKL